MPNRQAMDYREIPLPQPLPPNSTASFKIKLQDGSVGVQGVKLNLKANRWNRVTVVADGQGVQRTYVNGKRVDPPLRPWERVWWAARWPVRACAGAARWARGRWRRWRDRNKVYFA